MISHQTLECKIRLKKQKKSSKRHVSVIKDIFKWKIVVSQNTVSANVFKDKKNYKILQKCLPKKKLHEVTQITLFLIFY